MVQRNVPGEVVQHEHFPLLHDVAEGLDKHSTGKVDKQFTVCFF
jgi:hypothetical protein